MKLIAWVGVLAAIIFGIWKYYGHCQLAKYGIAEANPLGEFAKLDSVIRNEMKCTRDEAGSDALLWEDLPPATITYRYMDPQTGAGFPDKIWVQTGADGRVTSISALSQVHYAAVVAFMAYHWERVTGESHSLSDHEDDFENGRIRAKWTHPMEGVYKICMAVK